MTPVDAAGWRPSEGELDRYGREIPDEEYGTADFERIVALRARTEAIARHLRRARWPTYVGALGRAAGATSRTSTGRWSAAPQSAPPPFVAGA